DPEAMENVERIFGDKIAFSKSMYDALEGSDFMVLATEWTVFRTPDFQILKDKLKDQTIFDGRNVYDKSQMLELGFNYYSIGRP
ncbi:MAG: UDP-glucose 6-dehydrogenase, partial [Bacteroidetes bacterium]|nr:UDP-glucose 6-dehydrogenase [Bacteroidota bacterium]